MIITKLKGGLGNQMFQYACGRALSLRNKDQLKLDISGYERQGTDTPRSYSLSHFKIKETTIATPGEISKIAFSIKDMLRRKLLRDFNIGWKKNIILKKGDIYLDGFWQTEKYFSDVGDAIKKEFTLTNPLGKNAAAIAEMISSEQSAQSTPSVSVHIRRGDVARDAATNPYFGCTPPEYYSRALQYLAERIKNFRVFVFSDDIEWVTKNIAIPYPTTYVSSNDPARQIPDYEELALMSLCDHNIIANSSFSWWGAWLNPRMDKIVIAPKKWIQRGEKIHKDTVPPSWIRL
jgi:hypothetical protein